MDVRSLLRLFNREIGEIPGFLNRKQALVWAFLFNEQARMGIRGGAIEIGVFQGRSAALLGALLGPDEPLLLVDPFQSPEIADRMSRIAPQCRYTFVANSSDSPAAREAVAAAGAPRFFHVDGRHTADFVRREIALAESVLHADGLVCVDDFYSERYPEVTLGVFDAVRAGSLKFLLSAFNKCYLARPEAHARYLAAFEAGLISWFREAEFDNLTLFRSAGDLHCLSLGKRYKDADVFGPD